VRTVVADSNVFVSYFYERSKQQQDAAQRFLDAAEAGEIAGIIPQFIVYEILFVLQSQYALTPRQLNTVVAAVTSFPGMQIINDWPSKRLLEIWPDPLPAVTDATLVALATTNHYDAIATFDRKLANKLESFGLTNYF
jgi:predicted nucleic acid-binding protein